MSRRTSSTLLDGERVTDVGDQYLSLRSLARYAGISVRTIRGFIVRRHEPLPHYRIGGKILVRRLEFDQWASKFRVARPPIDLENVVGDVMRGLE
jgi:excisionase family DNA binding protein